MVYDTELAIKDVISVFKSDLNAAITKINAEKNDAIVLQEMNATDFYFWKIDKALLNNSGYFILYSIDNGEQMIESNEASTMENVTVNVYACTFDDGKKDSEEILYKLLRYRRALETVSKNNPDMFRGFAKTEMVSLKPDVWQFNNDVIVYAGVSISSRRAN